MEGKRIAGTKRGMEGGGRSTAGRLPARCLAWLLSSRLEFLGDILKNGRMKFFSAHLPVMATWPDVTRTGPGGFSVNMTVKGIGLLPAAGLLADYTDIFESTLADARGCPWAERRSKRVEASARLDSDAAHFDPAVLGGLEIFMGKAAGNMMENPRASLLYSGMKSTPAGMEYISFQVNGAIEILGKQNPYYRFLLASRKLFEFEKFHLFQSDYPFGYLIRVEEVLDKSPFPGPR